MLGQKKEPNKIPNTFLYVDRVRGTKIKKNPPTTSSELAIDGKRSAGTIYSKL